MQLMEIFPMTHVVDLSRSLAVFDQNTSLIVVVELSEASWRCSPAFEKACPRSGRVAAGAGKGRR